METITYEDDDDQKQAPFTASPLDAWRGARKPAEPEPKPKPKPKTKKTRKAISVGPAIRRMGPITIDFK
jgi:hypothetical protein